jgi:hypothetical protein
LWLAHFFALFDFTIAQNKKAHAEKTAKRLCPVRRQRCLQNIFTVILSNYYGTSLGRDCNNNFLSMANQRLSARIVFNSLPKEWSFVKIASARRSASRTVARGKAHPLSCNPICEPLL